ncbi:hypothetical protein BD311DRAFT_755204 [Dichomitus squalens]|uniref:Nephrocystin 3-like N-terminal domain-containing protein n=1 Tax=Dichomitus squalens TaxID=114155 RepID=A0A4Q9MQH7_9APHY|nr:hypothetical protein BD311DRAFT_755204 [Dichomitus squalens]
MNCCFCSSGQANAKADAVLKGARLILTTSQNVTSMVPIPGIGPITTILIALIDKLTEMRSNQQGFEAVSREISQLVNTVDRAGERVMSEVTGMPTSDPRRLALVDGLQGSSKLQDRVNRLYTTLAEQKTRADKLYQGTCWLRWFYSTRDAAILTEIRQGIANAREYFKLECQVAIEASIEDVLETLGRIEVTVNAIKVDVTKENAINAVDRDERILEALPHADASYRAAVNAMKNSFIQGTRAELFDAMDEWIEGRNRASAGKAICILTGGAGTGKSTIASEFARRCDDAGDYGASFFFVRGVADLDSTRLVFPTIAYQLAHSQAAVRPHIVTAAREHLKRGKNQQMKYEAPNLLHRPVHDLDPRHPRMFLVVDAVDECSEEARTLVPEMLDLLLASVREARFPLRIFLTTRPNSLVEDKLRNSQWSQLVHKISLHDLSPESVERDIAIFVRDKISKLPAGEALLRDQPEVAHRLAHRAGGLFIYAKTAMDFLHDYPDFVEDRLDDLLSDGSSQFSAALQPLDDLYLTVLEIAFPSKDLSQSPRLRRPVEATLGSLAVLRNPLSPRVLESLIGVARKDICSVLNRLRSVVLYDNEKPDEQFRPMHATFPQFLVDPNRCMSPSYRVDTKRQHARLAKGCFQALLTLEQNVCQLPDPAVNKAAIPDLTRRLERHVPEHVRYACVHWTMHLGEACELATRHVGNECYCKDMLEALTLFVRTKLRNWIETMGYMGRLDMVVKGLDIARDYLTFSPQFEDLDTLLADSRQLVADHYWEIEECPHEVHQASSMPGGFLPTLNLGRSSRRLTKNEKRIELKLDY